jgi:hypothetical protein
MTSKLILPCFNCRDEHRRRNLKRIKDKYYCRSCAKQIREKHREETIEQTGIREELTKLKSKMCRESKAKHHKPKIVHQKAPKRVKTASVEPPKPKNSKRKSNYFKIPYLTRAERQILWKKYINQGFSNEEANQKIKEFTDYQTKLFYKLKEQKKTESEMGQRFREAFWKVCQEAGE